MCLRKNLAVALGLVSCLCLIALALGLDRSLAPGGFSEPAPTQLNLRCQVSLQDRLSYVYTAALSPDGKYLALGGYRDDSFRCLSLWNVTTGAELATIPRHADAREHAQSTWSLALSPDDRWLVSASNDVVRFWNVDNQSEERTLRVISGDDVTAVAFADDNATVAAGAERGVIRLMDGASGRETTILRGHTAVILCLAFSPDGRTLASGGYDCTVRLWDVVTGEALATFRRHTQPVRSVAFAPDGQILASGSEDRTVRLWSVSRREELATLPGHGGIVSSLAFSPDGKLLATGGYDNLVRLWNVAARRLRATAEHVSATGDIQKMLWCLSFAGDGRTLLTCGSDGIIRYWDVPGEL
jgi:WD40 repeat protein